MVNWATNWYVIQINPFEFFAHIRKSKQQLLTPTITLVDHQVQHAKREQSLKDFPIYQTDLVRAITREIRDLDRDVTDILEPFQGHFDPAENLATATALLVHHLCMRRNKRCLLAYHRVRAEKIEQLCWNGGDIQSQSQHAQQQEDTTMSGGGGGSNRSGDNGGGDDGRGAAENVMSSLSPEEDEYARQYGDLLAAYKGQWTDIDLTGSMDPPKDLFIDVRVLKDAGEIQTEYG